MKYFIDTEFIEGFHKPLFGKRRHFIDLISIGIAAEDGREYYAISNEFNPKIASQWVKDNVISKLPAQKVSFHDSPRARMESLLWKSNKQIAEDIVRFCLPWTYGIGKERELPMADGSTMVQPSKPEFYAYYADYDWVVFCSLFGTMMGLPKEFPKYCRDLKQTLDEKAVGRMPLSLESNIDFIKKKPDYPKQSNEHNALDDAKWNRSFYRFLQKL